MAKSKKSRCYLYTRVSTEMQIEGYSLDAQEDRLRKEAKHRDMQVVEVFSDEGKSGKNTAVTFWSSNYPDLAGIRLMYCSIYNSCRITV